jgi:RNA polymerase sigma factor (sigma-70 family)
MEPLHELVLTDTDHDVAGAISREAGKLAAFIKARVRNAADAEDILQDVFFEFIQAYQLPESIERVGGWLFRVARNRIIDRFRKKKEISFSASEEQDGGRDTLHLNIELPSPEGDPEAEFARSAFLTALQIALEELPANQREVFVGHEIEGLSFENLSRRDGIPVNTLLSRKRYAVLYLRERLQVFHDELEI